MKHELSVAAGPYLYVATNTYGVERRKIIKDWFTANPTGRYCVNARRRPQVKNDPDLKKLIRIGFLKQIRVHTDARHAVTYLEKV